MCMDVLSVCLGKGLADLAVLIIITNKYVY